MEKFKMDRKRLQKLACIITENYVSESIPQNVMNQKYKYVGKTLEIEPGSDVFDSLDDFFAEIRYSWDTTETEVQKYIDSLSYEGGKIVSNHSGTKQVELVKQ
jgi:hypothetical protein